MIGYDITITNATPPSPSNHVPPSSIDCITNYTANADLSLQDHERNKLNRSNNRRTTPLISGDDVIGNLLHNQMILTPIAIDAHGRVGPMTCQKFYGTPPPPNRPNAKAMYDLATTLPAPIGIFIEADQRWKQLQADNPKHNQKFYGLSHYAPTPSITTIQQLGLGITHAFSTLIINSFKKLVHSQTSPAFDHYGFLLPRDQFVGLMLDNSLDVDL
jgi:hypothetical protein